MALVGVEVVSPLEKSGSESHYLLVRESGIVDVEVEVNLLRGAVRPVRGNVVWCKLHANPPIAGGVKHAMPPIVFDDTPVKEPGPERALRMEVCRVEHNDLTNHLHGRILEGKG
jgi:hypothetical protein